VQAHRVAIRLEGDALHAGCPTAVTLARHDGPITFAQDGRVATLDTLVAARTDWGLELTDGMGLRIDLTEHLLGAIGGLGIRHGLMATVEGPEIPLLDGGARRAAEALRALGIAPSPPTLSVERSACLRAGEAEYEFQKADGIGLEVDVSFDHPAIGVQRAHWNGDPTDFVDAVAACRTFGFTRDAEVFEKAGRAKLVRDGRSLGAAVIVFTDRGLFDPRIAPGKNEIAGHKLLDLIGDLALYGGPPKGRIVARRPGHTATHAVVQKALADGVLCRVRAP
jgi:UDP-3-O-[3-hydroxymyristoyl] N-acetylglucosamine deacetylase